MPEGQLDALIGTIRRLVGRASAGDCTDSELLGRFCADHDEGRAALLQPHGPLVLNVCRRVLGNDHHADGPNGRPRLVAHHSFQTPQRPAGPFPIREATTTQAGNHAALGPGAR